MKKKNTAILAAILCATMSVTAFAANPSTITSLEEGENTQDIGVTGTYSAATTVYSVDMVWGNMEFTYTGASNGTWDPETRSYVNPVEAGWSCAATDRKITLTNRSNDSVKAAFSYAAATGYETITGSFYQDAGSTDPLTSIIFKTADAYQDGTATVPAGAREAEAYFNITTGGTLPTTATSLALAGTITVTLTPVA